MAREILLFLTALSLLSPFYVRAHETAGHTTTAPITPSISTSVTVKIGAGNTKQPSSRSATSHSNYPVNGTSASTSVSSHSGTWATSVMRTLSTSTKHTSYTHSGAGPPFPGYTSSKSASDSTYKQESSTSNAGSVDASKTSYPTRSHHSISSSASFQASPRRPLSSSTASWHPSKQNVSSTHYHSSGFMTSFASDAWSDLPASLTREPPPLTGKPASSLLAGLATYKSTTTPGVGYISTGVSSDSHSNTGFPIFWGHSHFCFVSLLTLIK